MKKFMTYNIYKKKLSFYKNSFIYIYIYRMLIYFYYFIKIFLLLIITITMDRFYGSKQT